MEKRGIEDLRARVACGAVLVRAGFAIDRRESTRRALKYRRGGEIVIVNHGGRGWFDPLSDAKGDVFGLAKHLDGSGFVDALGRVADLAGLTPHAPVWSRDNDRPAPALGLAERWRVRRRPWPGSMTWRYLRDERGLPETILRAAIRRDLLREGPRGSLWAAHTDEAGTVTGWEARGPEWRGFCSGGAKVLFRFGPTDAGRFCVTEAAIDAMSLATIEGSRERSLYLSTGGGWSSATEAAVRVLATRPGARLVAATDNDGPGEAFAARLRLIAEAAGCDWQRLKPSAEDWNDVLKQKGRQDREWKERGNCRVPAGRVKGDASPGCAGP